MKTSRNISGYSLIELMVSMTLGLLMLGVALQFLVSSSATQSASQASNRIQENARFALEILAENIRLAGYADPAAGSQPGFIYTAACDTFDPCTDNGLNDLPDRIGIWLNPPPDDGTETDCTGTVVPANDQIANVFYLETDGGTNISNLMCRGFNVDANAWVATAQPLVEGIDALQFLYGIGDGTRVSRYLSADAVPDWTTVMSVRIAILASAGISDGESFPGARTYQLLDSPPLTFNDRQDRRVFSTTVVINNAFDQTL